MPEESPFRNPFVAHTEVGIPLQGQTWEDLQFEDEDWSGLSFQNCVFERVRFVTLAMAQTTFVRCRFVDCVFEGTDLVASQWVECTGTGRHRIVGGTLAQCTWSECEYERFEVEQAGQQLTFALCRIGELHFVDAGLGQNIITLTDTKIGRLVGEGLEWSDASAFGAELADWEIGRARFLRCSLMESQASGLDLASVTFDGCNLYRSELGGVKLRSVERCLFTECELTDADFREADVAGGLFSKARAGGARFDEARLEGALFPDADLRRASFARASAQGSVWSGADLTDANLELLSARASTFRNAVLTGAAVAGADLRDTDLHGVEGDLTEADTRDSRGSVEWRADRERELQRLRETGTGD